MGPRGSPGCSSPRRWGASASTPYLVEEPLERVQDPRGRAAIVGEALRREVEGVADRARPARVEELLHAARRDRFPSEAQIAELAAAAPLVHRTSSDPDLHAYGAKVQPHGSRPDRLRIGYRVDKFDLPGRLAYADLHRPPFVELPLER